MVSLIHLIHYLSKEDAVSNHIIYTKYSYITTKSSIIIVSPPCRPMTLSRYTSTHKTSKCYAQFIMPCTFAEVTTNDKFQTQVCKSQEFQELCRE